MKAYTYTLVLVAALFAQPSFAQSFSQLRVNDVTVSNSGVPPLMAPVLAPPMQTEGCAAKERLVDFNEIHVHFSQDADVPCRVDSNAVANMNSLKSYTTYPDGVPRHDRVWDSAMSLDLRFRVATEFSGLAYGQSVFQFFPHTGGSGVYFAPLIFGFDKDVLHRPFIGDACTNGCTGDTIVRSWVGLGSSDYFSWSSGSGSRCDPIEVGQTGKSCSVDNGMTLSRTNFARALHDMCYANGTDKTLLEPKSWGLGNYHFNLEMPAKNPEVFDRYGMSEMETRVSDVSRGVSPVAGGLPWVAVYLNGKANAQMDWPQGRPFTLMFESLNSESCERFATVNGGPWYGPFTDLLDYNWGKVTDPFGPGSYGWTVTCRNSAGAATSTATLNVLAGARPTVTSVQGIDATIPRGKDTFLYARVSGSEPEGTVVFRDLDTSVQYCTPRPLERCGSDKTVVCQVQWPTAGTRRIVAEFTPTTAFDSASTSTPYIQTVTETPSSATVSVAASANPSPTGEPLRFLATVEGRNPTGSVRFLSDNRNVSKCSAIPLNGSGNSRTATCVTSDLPAGTHTVVAVYGGDADNGASTSPAITQAVVNGTGSSVAILTSRNPASVSEILRVEVRVTGSNPSGRVSVESDGGALVGCVDLALRGTGNTKTATCAVNTLTVGTHALVAHYSGDANNSASNSTVLAQVVQATPLVAQAFVSAANGNDANASAGCAVQSPCRTFAAASSAVASGGEVVALSSGEYGPVAATRSLALVANPGVFASITVTSGVGVEVSNPGATVVLRGLVITGSGGQHGIRAWGGSRVAIERCHVSGFGTGAGILAEGAAGIRVADSSVKDNSIGIKVGAGSTLTLTRSRLMGNASYGVRALGNVASTRTRVVVEQTTLQGTGADWGISAESLDDGAEVSTEIFRSSLSNSGRSVVSVAGTGTARVHIARTSVTGSVVGLYQSGTGAVLGSLGNNRLAGNQSNVVGVVQATAAR